MHANPTLIMNKKVNWSTCIARKYPALILSPHLLLFSTAQSAHALYHADNLQTTPSHSPSVIPPLASHAPPLQPDSLRDTNACNTGCLFGLERG